MTRAWLSYLPLVLSAAWLLGCRGQFDISQYLAEDSTSDPSESDTDESPDSESSDSESMEADATEGDTGNPEEEEETSSNCATDQLELADGCIGLRQMIDTEVAGTDLALAEFTGDNQIDLLLAGAEFRLWSGDFGGLSDSYLALAGLVGSHVAVADISDDGVADFAAIGPTVELLIASGGGFVPGGSIPVDGVDGAFLDLDGDTDLDLVVSGATLRTLTVERGSWSLAAELPYGGERLDVANFDDEAALDVALARPASDQLALFRSSGDGSLVMPTQTLLGELRDVAAVNLDGDEALELVAVGNSDKLDIYDVSSNFEVTPHSIFEVGQDPRGLALADVDGDGLLDAVTVNHASDDLSLLLGDGGSFTPELRMPLPDPADDPIAIAAADLDADDRAELVVLAPGTQHVYVFGYVP